MNLYLSKFSNNKEIILYNFFIIHEEIRLLLKNRIGDNTNITISNAILLRQDIIDMLDLSTNNYKLKKELEFFLYIIEKFFEIIHSNEINRLEWHLNLANSIFIKTN